MPGGVVFASAWDRLGFVKLSPIVWCFFCKIVRKKVKKRIKKRQIFYKKIQPDQKTPLFGQKLAWNFAAGLVTIRAV